MFVFGMANIVKIITASYKKLIFVESFFLKLFFTKLLMPNFFLKPD